MTYVDHVLEVLADDGEREVLVSGATRLTRTQARDRILSFADGLHRRGIRPGDGVGVFVGNTADGVLLEIAVHLVGGRLVFVPPEPGTNEMRALIKTAELELVVVDPDFDDRAAELDGVPLPDLPGDPVERTPAADFATVFYTGGTTGTPKLAVHGPEMYSIFVALRGVVPPQVVLGNTLITHGTGHGNAVMALITGSKLVLGGSVFDAGEFVRLAREERITATQFVPPMMYEVLDHPDCPGPQFASVSLSGAPVAPRRLRQAVEKWGKVVWQAYGLSEVMGVTSMNPAEIDLDDENTLRTVGKPNPHIEVQIRDGGEIWARGSQVMRGYWGQPPVDGWFNTGDVGHLDENGYLYLDDRSKDVIVTGRTSDNVYSRLLDDYLVTLPGIRAAAAVGAPDEAMGEHVHLFLVPEEGCELDLDEIRASVVAELGSLYGPKGATIVPRLPHTKVGKVDKKKLRSMLG